jgi:integrase
MPAKTAKVLGPYFESARGKWRLVVKEEDRRKSLWFASDVEANTTRERLIAALADRGSMTIGDAVDRFLTVKTRQGIKEITQRELRDKMFRLIPFDATLGSMSAARAQTLYDALTERVAVATHHKCLRRVREFFTWCVREKYIDVNPFAEVRPIGKPNAGKPQLRQDEARKLSDVLLECAGRDDTSALALLVQVLLGLRSSEVLRLRKRDLDRNGSVFVVDGTKNKNARRTLGIESPIVRHLLAQRVANLTPDALVFAPVTRKTPFASDHLYKKLKGYCQLAGVPLVCPHSLRGLHSSLAVQVGATSAHVAQALGHSSFEITRRHYLAPGTLESSRIARMSDTLLGDGKLEALLAELRTLTAAQLEHVARELGFRR